MKITTLEESADFATLDTEKLFSKLKSHKLSRKGHPNHDASLSAGEEVSHLAQVPQGEEDIT
jgi:hypothetical protein